jgi:multisubunit Na+/H+ antiporter MnhC subunit
MSIVSSALKATILALVIAGVFLIAVAPFLPSILPTSCSFPCTPPDPNGVTVGSFVIGSAILFLAVVLELVGRREHPTKVNNEMKPAIS